MKVGKEITEVDKRKKVLSAFSLGFVFELRLGCFLFGLGVK